VDKSQLGQQLQGTKGTESACALKFGDMQGHVGPGWERFRILPGGANVRAPFAQHR
jgi:hypothetical protein